MGDKRRELKGSIRNEKLDVLSGSIDQRGVAIVREGNATRVNLDESGATCDGNPKGTYDIHVAATFRVPLTTVGDLHMLINDIKAGKHDELLSEMTNDDRMETLDALGTICNSIQADRNVILNKSDSMSKGVLLVKALNDPNADDNMPGTVLPSDPIAQSVEINTKSTSYAGAAVASAKDQPKVNSNFRLLVVGPVFDGVNISIPRKVVENVSIRFEHTLYGYFIRKRMAFSVVKYYARNNWAKHGLKRIMMNNKSFFFFKFNSRAGLEAVLEGGPWLIQDGISLIATFIGKPVMLDSYTSSMCNDSWGRSSFARYLIEVSSEVNLMDVVTIGIPYLIGEDFTKETIRVEYEWRPPRCDVCKIWSCSRPMSQKGVGKKKKRKGKFKSNNGGQFAGPSVKQTVRYEPKATTNTPKKGATNKGNESIPSSLMKNWGNYLNKDNVTSSNSFFALNVEEEDEEDEVENVYDETANLFTKTGGSSFTAAAG
ncbi:zinc knuckle CX2CX4HX4C containing protein [Tanacetum coccineum]